MSTVDVADVLAIGAIAGGAALGVAAANKHPKTGAAIGSAIGGFGFAALRVLVYGFPTPQVGTSGAPPRLHNPRFP